MVEVIVVVNQMDAVDWGQDRFESIQHQSTTMLQQIGFKIQVPSKIPCIPAVGCRWGLSVVGAVASTVCTSERIDWGESNGEEESR